MPTLAKARLYRDTILHLKLSQVLFRIWRKAGGSTPLRWGYTARVSPANADISRVALLPMLDFDPTFLARFDCEAIVRDELTLLHHTENIDWETCWHSGLWTPLWQFNLHYHEYLLPLAKRYIDSSEERYLLKAKAIIESWIQASKIKGLGVAWDPYTISMRLANWLAFYGELEDVLKKDQSFTDAFNASLADQYSYLSRHLEKDLLANHYFENLKALVLGALYFGDNGTLSAAFSLFGQQVEEQILPDGMHYELSVMYHKIVLEDVLRVAASLDEVGHELSGLKSYIQSMCDFLYSIERGANRTPLFNDSGDNVAKSREFLLRCAQQRFGVAPSYRSEFPDAGYYLLEGCCGGKQVKIIFDAGKSAPGYACGHMHCDALSIEVFVDSSPWVVNLGTFAYQSEHRLELKKTSGHSAPQISNVEQSECWASFRVARMARCRVVETGDDFICAEICDHLGNRIQRSVRLLGDRIMVEDRTSSGLNLVVHYHFLKGNASSHGGLVQLSPYCPEFGIMQASNYLEIEGGSIISAQLNPATLSIEVQN